MTSFPDTLKRRKTRRIVVGRIAMGADEPVRVQSMCNTDTRDAAGTVRQILQLESAGCEISRVAVPDMEAALKLGFIKKRIHTPLVADIHFDHRLALEALRQGVDKIRINPGNIGERSGVEEVVRACKSRGVPIRIGVNAGSLKRLKTVKGKPPWTSLEWARTMVKEVLEETAVLEELDFKDIVVSLKADDTQRTLLANRIFSEVSDIPLHIGVTEAGGFLSGTVKSSIALGILLMEGIGDTIRCSLTEDPVTQVRCSYEILKTLQLRTQGPEIISCPTCGRCRVDVRKVITELEKRIYSDPLLLSRSAGMKIAVMGCVVNGPGEARDADFGIAGGRGSGVWIEAGKAVRSVKQREWVKTIIERIKYGKLKSKETEK